MGSFVRPIGGGVVGSVEGGGVGGGVGGVSRCAVGVFDVGEGEGVVWDQAEGVAVHFECALCTGEGDNVNLLGSVYGGYLRSSPSSVQ